MKIADVQYATVTRPVPQEGEIPDYQIELYQELPEGVTLARQVGGRSDKRIYGLLILDDKHEATVTPWLEEKKVRFGWTYEKHDSYTAAEATLHNMMEAPQ